MAAPGQELEPLSRRYAVLWSDADGDASGRLEVLDDRFELAGREGRVAVPFADVVAASIGRDRPDRLRGLPVLRLLRRDGRSIRIASLEGVGALHELVRFAELTPAF